MKNFFWLLIFPILILTGCGSKREATPAKNVNRISHAVPVSSDQTRRLISEARRWIGTPYRYGGQTLSGTDCSGFVMMVYDDVYGLKLPRTSVQMREYALPIAEKDLAPGDLVFFCTSGASRVNHVGLYIGSGKMIHASLSQGVTESSLDEKYYRQRFHSAGRVVHVGKNAHVNQSADTSSATTLPSDRRELKNRIKQLEKEMKQLSKDQNKSENKPVITTPKQPEKQPRIQQQQIETDSTYVTTDPSIFD